MGWEAGVIGICGLPCPGQGHAGEALALAGHLVPLASSSSADLAPGFLLGFTRRVQMAPWSRL